MAARLDMPRRTRLLIVELNDPAAAHRYFGQSNSWMDIDLAPVVDNEEFAAISLQIIVHNNA